MFKDIKIKKGFSINFKGEVEKVLFKVFCFWIFVIRFKDFYFIILKMVVKEGVKINVGDVLFYLKIEEFIKFVFFVSGILIVIECGVKRVIIEILIEVD